MNYIKIPKKILPLIKKNKYVTMAYGYVYSQKNYHGICYSSINLMSHVLKHKIEKNKDKGICYNLASALKILQDNNFIYNVTDKYFINLATNFGKKENSDFNYEKISMWSLNEGNDDDSNENNSENNIYSKGFILIEYEKFMELSLLYLPDVLNLYLYIISRINRNISEGYCSTSINTIIQDLGCSRNTIIKNIEILKKLNYIKDNNGWNNDNENDEKTKKTRRCSNKYWLVE